MRLQRVLILATLAVLPAWLSGQSLDPKAFTLFARAYDQCRRLVSYLRWDTGDAESIAPSIYVRKRRRNGEEAADSPESEQPVVTPNGNGVAPAPTPTRPDVPQLPFTD